MKFPPLSENEIAKSKEILTPIFNFIKKFHNHELIGAEKIDSNANYIFVSNHCYATYDCLLLGYAIYQEKKVFLRAVVDDLLFYTPGLNKLLHMFYLLPGKFKYIKEVLLSGQSVLILPGGMEEAIKSSHEKNKLFWKNRKGFIALSILTRTPIVLAACPQSDDLYEVYKNPITEYVFKKFRFPLPLAVGRVPFLPFLPRKVKLTHYIDGPYVPPTYENEADLEIKIDEFHAFIQSKMEELLKKS